MTFDFTRAEHLQLQFQYKSFQQRLFTILEDLDFLECVKMDKERNLTLELARHHIHNVFFLQRCFVGPEIVKPLQNPLFNVSSHFPEMFNKSKST